MSKRSGDPDRIEDPDRSVRRVGASHAGRAFLPSRIIAIMPLSRYAVKPLCRYTIKSVPIS